MKLDVIANKTVEFVETMNHLQDNPSTVIDTTALIYLLQVIKTDILAAYRNLVEMTEDTKIIVSEELSENALTLFPYLFSNSESFYEHKPLSENDILDTALSFSRKPLYTYNDAEDLRILLNYAEENDIPFTTFSYASGNLRSELEKFKLSSELALIDLTSVSYSIEDNRNLIYLVEGFLNRFPNIKLTALDSRTDEIFRLNFRRQQEGVWRE